MKNRIRCAICIRSLTQDKEIRSSPLCGICFNSLINFIETKDKTLAAGFALLKLRELSNVDLSKKIKDGLLKAKENNPQFKSGRPPTISLEKREQVIYLYKKGGSLRKIAKELKIGASSVLNIIKSYKTKDRW